MDVSHLETTVELRVVPVQASLALQMKKRNAANCYLADTYNADRLRVCHRNNEKYYMCPAKNRLESVTGSLVACKLYEVADYRITYDNDWMLCLNTIDAMFECWCWNAWNYMQYNA